MAQTPDEIRTEIEDTRSRMSDTVGAIGHRANLPGRAKEAIGGAVHRVTGAMPDPSAVTSGARDAASKAGDVLPSAQQVKRAASVAQSNPLGLMIGAAAVGFVTGMMIPSTRMEDERIGELADDLKQQVREVGQEAAQRGREVVEQTAEAAGEAVQSVGREQGQELAQSVQQRVQDGSGS